MSSFGFNLSVKYPAIALGLVLFTPLIMAAGAVEPVTATADAEAHSPTLGTVVVTGSRVEHSSFDLPASIDVVTGCLLYTSPSPRD